MRRTFMFVAGLACIVLTVPRADAAVLTGASGDDVIFGTRSADRLDGTTGADLIFGKGNPKDKKDKVLGGNSSDELFGGPGPDLLDGGEDVAMDFLHDGDGKSGDVLRGGPGGDWILGADGARDTVDCGPGTDGAIVDPTDKVIGCELVVTGSYPSFTLPNGFDNRAIFGTSGADLISGTADRDRIFGLSGPDEISLNTADVDNADIVDGGAGADTINGSARVDLIIDDDGVAGDVIFAGVGTDVIFSADGAIDSIDCGPGVEADTVYADPDDELTNCEGPGIKTGDGVIL